MKSRLFAFVIVTLTSLMSSPSSAAVSDQEFQALRQQLIALGQRLDDLEDSNHQLRLTNASLVETSQQTAASITSVSDKSTEMAKHFERSNDDVSWADRISLSGDFRFRYEGIDEQGQGHRNRNRIRARELIVARVSNDVEVGLGMASGDDDPVSTNQTLGGGGTTKGLNLDLAYFRWSGLENTSIVAGKFKNIFYKPDKNQLLWDGDWNPEGVGLVWANGDFFASAMSNWLESDSNKESEFSYGVQAGFNKMLGEKLKLTAGIGYYKLGTRGKGSFFGDEDDFFGNSFDPETNTYLYDYEELELFADLGFEIGSKPASLFFDYVQNQDANEFDTGYTVGFKYGSAKSAGTWEGALIYQDLEADAVFGLVADSDFAGGGTDGKGYILKGGYALVKNWNANFTYFITETGENAGNLHDYDRLQLDLAMKF